MLWAILIGLVINLILTGLVVYYANNFAETHKSSKISKFIGQDSGDGALSTQDQGNYQGLLGMLRMARSRSP